MPARRLRRLRTLALPPGAEFAAALDEAWAAGDAVLPLDPQAPPAATERLLAAMRPDLPVDDGIALVIATSGSTGVPKGAQLTHAALAASAAATAVRLGIGPDDRWLSCLPWHHIGGLQVLLRARLGGSPLVVHDRFDVDRFAAETDATLVSLVPTQLARLIDAGVDLSRFRAVLLGGAAAGRGLLDRARAAGAPVVTTYGMSETCGGCVYDGRPLDGVDVRVDDDRRVWLRGPMLMAGYRLDPARTAETLPGGWLRTSDVGSWDGERLTVHGRADDVVVTGGENVDTTAVAHLLEEHPDIAAAAVLGVPDDEWGQRVVAVVVPADGRAPGLDELRDWVRSRLPAAAAPKAVVTVAALPMLASGKPDRLALRALAAG